MKQKNRLVFVEVIVLIPSPHVFSQRGVLGPQDCFGMLGDIVIASEVPIVGGHATPADYEAATGKPITQFNQALSLQEKVADGELSPVEERFPAEPLVYVPVDSIGVYGGFC